MALELTTSYIEDSIGLFRYSKLLAEKAIAQVTVNRYIGCVEMACPMFCTSWIVNVAQRAGQLSRRSRGYGEVGSVLRFPLPHTPL